MGPRNKIGHPAHRYRQVMLVPVLSARGVQRGSNTCVIAYHNDDSNIYLEFDKLSYNEIALCRELV